MYASKRSVAKAQGINTDSSKNYRINKIRHRGMQKDRIQITPDGKMIQHYRYDSRTAAFMKALKASQAKVAAEDATKEAEVKPEANATEELPEETKEA